MIIVMKAGAEQQDIDAVIARIREFNYQPHPIQGTERTVIAAIGDERGKHELQQLESMRGVDKGCTNLGTLQALRQRNSAWSKNEDTDRRCRNRR